MSIHEESGPFLDADGDCLMSLELAKYGPATVIAVSGEIDRDNAHLLTDLIAGLHGPELQPLVLNLQRVRFIGAAGVNALLRVRHLVARQQGELILRNPSPIVMTVLAGTQVRSAFQIHPNSARQAAD